MRSVGVALLQARVGESRPTDHCHEQPGWAWQLACVARAPHGVTVPVHDDEVDCQ